MIYNGIGMYAKHCGEFVQKYSVRGRVERLNQRPMAY